MQEPGSQKFLPIVEMLRNNDFVLAICEWKVFRSEHGECDLCEHKDHSCPELYCASVLEARLRGLSLGGEQNDKFQVLANSLNGWISEQQTTA